MTKDQPLQAYLSYVESAERMMDRRHNDNSLFIVTHFILFMFIVFNLSSSKTMMLLSGFGLFCLWAWYSLTRYYRCQVSAKYELLNDLEEEYFPARSQVYINEYKKLSQDGKEGVTKLTIGNKTVWYSDVVYNLMWTFLTFYIAAITAAFVGIN